MKTNQTFVSNGTKFVISAYKEDVFVNVNRCESPCLSVSINIFNKKVSTWGKADTEWKKFVKTLDIDDIIKKSDAIYGGLL